MKYYLMKDKRREVRGEIIELADESESQEWVTTHDRTFHGVVDTLEEAEHWVEEVYDPTNSNETVYVVEGKEIYFDVEEEKTIIKRKATAIRED